MAAYSYNRVILIGNLTRDVEIKYLQNGTAVAEIGLAVNDRRKTAQGEWVDEAVFVDVTLWGRTAEVAGEYLSKGSGVFIEGRLKYDTWEKEGKKHSKLRVVAEVMRMIGGKGGPGGGSGGPRGGSASSGGPSFDESESGGGYEPEVPAAPRGNSGGGRGATRPADEDIPF